MAWRNYSRIQLKCGDTSTHLGVGLGVLKLWRLNEKNGVGIFGKLSMMKLQIIFLFTKLNTIVSTYNDCKENFERSEFKLCFASVSCKSYYFLWLSICSSLKWDDMADTPNLPSFSTLPFVTLLCVLGDWIQGLHQQTPWLMILIGFAQWGAGRNRGWQGCFLPRQAPSSTAVSPLFLDIGYPAVTSPWFSVASHGRIHYSLLWFPLLLPMAL